MLIEVKSKYLELQVQKTSLLQSMHREVGDEAKNILAKTGQKKNLLLHPNKIKGKQTAPSMSGLKFWIYVKMQENFFHFHWFLVRLSVGANIFPLFKVDYVNAVYFSIHTHTSESTSPRKYDVDS